ncbi:fatty acyl-CoA reductase 1-like isoform X2 [Tubulanus polymorphus]|uniref:fatty acyl-CoA reductase 1-like isoform X2 n=1 Tax=Tubulanus polymorphus TaxID=672921 RepID=UPI003DA5F98E
MDQITKNHMNSMTTIPTIPEFYEGKSVFITGGSGFLGKVLIEKILRCCPGVKNLYLLMRPKRGKCVGDRLDELINLQVFDRLRKEQPDFKHKLIPIKGDVTSDELGIGGDDLALLRQDVSIVIHSAATVRFDEPLRVAMEMNVKAVRKMITLCRSLPHLISWVHVSTAYANCDILYIEEKVYPPPVPPQKLIEALDWMDDAMIDQVTPKLIKNKPNTYTFTKHLAEALLTEEATDLPIAIVRPSIIGAAWKEPYPGWIDNVNGPSGFYIAEIEQAVKHCVGKGILRSMVVECEAIADIVPVDLPVNMIVSAAWYTAVMKPETRKVYNCTIGTVNPFTWGEMSSVVQDYFKRNPLEAAFRRPQLTFHRKSEKSSFDYWNFINHIIPAHLADLAFRLVGQKPRMVRIFKRLQKMISTMSYFTQHTWEWTHTNSEVLTSSLTPNDKKQFYYDSRALNWPEYIEEYCLGTKKYILNEDLSGLPAARAHLRKLRNIRYAFNTVMVIVLWRVLIARSQFARNLWFFVLNLVFKFVRFFRISGTLNRH